METQCFWAKQTMGQQSGATTKKGVALRTGTTPLWHKSL